MGNFCSWCGGRIIRKTYYAKDKGGHLFYFGSEKCKHAWEKQMEENKECVD